MLGGVDARPVPPKNYAGRVTSTSSDPSTSPSASPGTAPSGASAQLRVEGMHCGSCVALIEETLTEQTGVRAASVDLESALAVVEYDPALVSPDRLRATIVEAGYSATMVG